MTVANPFELSYKELRRSFIGNKVNIVIPVMFIWLGGIAITMLTNSIYGILGAISFFASVIFISVYGIEREQTLVRKYYEKENNLK